MRTAWLWTVLSWFIWVVLSKIMLTYVWISLIKNILLLLINRVDDDTFVITEELDMIKKTPSCFANRFISIILDIEFAIKEGSFKWVAVNTPQKVHLKLINIPDSRKRVDKTHQFRFKSASVNSLFNAQFFTNKPWASYWKLLYVKCKYQSINQLIN